MSRDGVDSFLTCVMRRSENDGVITVGSVLLLMIVIPVIVYGVCLFLLLIASDSGAYSLDMVTSDDFVAVAVFSSIISALVVYRMMDSYNGHKKRDLVWTSSLIAYAKSYGHDVSGLESAAAQLSTDKSELVTKILMVYAVIISIIHLILCFLGMTGVMDLGNINTVVSVMSLGSFILMTIAASLVFIYSRRHNNLQCEFSRQWTEVMKDEFPGMAPMEIPMFFKKLWPHLILVVITFGLYSYILVMISVHGLNTHVFKQWTYETNLLNAIRDKEGATGYEVVAKDYGTGINSLVKRMF